MIKNITTLHENELTNKKLWKYVTVGKVIFLRCLTLKVDEVRYSNFIGVCTNIRHKTGSLSIVNNVKKERIETRFSVFSPILDQITILKRYKKKYRLRNINNII